MNKRGFTMLEILLVIGVAAVLTVGSVTIYNLVNNVNKVNDTVKLMHIILQAMREGNEGTDVYGAPGEDLMPYLVSSKAVPSRYVSAGRIVAPFDTPVTVGVDPNPEYFYIELSGLPTSAIPEVAANFDVVTDPNIIYLHVCGKYIWPTAGSESGVMTTKHDVTYFAELCSGATNGDNFTIVSR